jgi:hypothetical protein
MQLKPGTRLRSAVCTTEVMTVRAPGDDVDLRCGGVPMLLPDDDAPAGASLDAAHAGGTLLGKRYADEDSGLEVLCTKAGDGSLSIGDVPVGVKTAKPLPSSD